VFVLSIVALFAAELGFDMTQEFQNNIVYLAMLVVGGYSLEDLAGAIFRQVIEDLPEDVAEIVAGVTETEDDDSVG
jgi:hypothetical protein